MTELGELLKLYSFESVYKSEDEKAIADWIEWWLDDNKIENYERIGNTIFRLGNIEAPILSAHLDQVKTNGKAVKFYMNDDEKIIAFNDKWEQTSLGADDKNGIWIILQAIKTFPDHINFIISEGEETGCHGIHMLEDEKLLDLLVDERQFCLVLDRRGNRDMLKSGGGSTFCSTLAQDLCNFLEQDFEVTTGSISDTCTLCKYCESVNMSVAYENPHTAREITDYKRLKEIKEHVIDVIDNFVHYSTPPSVYKTVYTSTYKGGYYNGY
jgi:hypothetical protein